MGLLGDYLPDWLPDDPNKKAAARAGLLNLGAALMGGQGNMGQILGNGLMAGAQGYHGTLGEQQKQALQAEQMRHYTMENKKLQNELDEPMNLQKIIAGGGPVASPPGARGASPMSALPQIGQPSAPLAAGAPSAAPASLFQNYIAIGDRLANAGRADKAKQYYELAEKLRPKLKEQSARTVDGKRVMANVFDDGTTSAVEGFAPDAEKLHFANTGGSTAALDPFTGKPVSTIKNTQSPDSVASVAESARGHNMADERAKEANHNARGVIIQTDTGPMLANTKTGATQQIIGPDGKPVTRTKALTEFQGKSAAFGDRAMAADKILDELGTKYSPAAINSKNYVEGVPLIGGAMGAATNKFALSENDQRAEQAQRDFINATLRQESGAAIGANEFDNARKQYFPQPGDTQKVREQKAANRKLVIEGFKRSAGANAEFTPAAPANNLPSGWTVEAH